MNQVNIKKQPYSNPYLAGVMLGLVLLASFIFLGAGFLASSGMARIGAFLEGLIFSYHTLSSQYFGKWGKSPLNYYLVYTFAGTFIAGLISNLIAHRIEFKVKKGNSFPQKKRLIFAMPGSILIAFASRLAGGYAAAYLVRRQWHD